MAKTKLLTPGQVEDFLQISRTTLDMLVKTGQLTVIKIGNLNRYCPDELHMITGVWPTYD